MRFGLIERLNRETVMCFGLMASQNPGLLMNGQRCPTKHAPDPSTRLRQSGQADWTASPSLPQPPNAYHEAAGLQTSRFISRVIQLIYNRFQQ